MALTGPPSTVPCVPTVNVVRIWADVLGDCRKLRPVVARTTSPYLNGPHEAGVADATGESVAVDVLVKVAVFVTVVVLVTVAISVAVGAMVCVFVGVAVGGVPVGDGVRVTVAVGLKATVALVVEVAVAAVPTLCI